ncbi:DUF2938 domain-containing protein [Microvirga lotononidis]|uniref:DUF2938 domain-containing protein n=1 Tax=Microvirga lotononidis TaxID=864069 RepID=UPI00058D8C6F|nr:DUF2938 domain-containing protein [Microvirga lotononidis]WQO29842.1 DUF2938 domain-containing protein [Microvirga lotononidis]
MIEFLYRSILIGIGATVIFDLWGLFLKHAFGLPGANWGPVGRWFCHLAGGRVYHEDIAKAPPFAYERAAGWIGHYAVGILFAAILLALAPTGWSRQPTLAPALIVGLVTVGAGWFLLQPGMGAGIAASKRPNANQIRALNIAGHIVFGLGLYASALLIR